VGRKRGSPRPGFFRKENVGWFKTIRFVKKSQEPRSPKFSLTGNNPPGGAAEKKRETDIEEKKKKSSRRRTG